VRQATRRIDNYHEERLKIIVVSPSGIFPMRSQKDFAVATMLPRNRFAVHARNIVDAAITKAQEHYGAYCKAFRLNELTMCSYGKYTDVAIEMGEAEKETEVVDSIRDVEVPNEGEPLAREDGEMTNVEMRRANEHGQAAREQTGLPERKLHPHPDGYKDEAADGKDDQFAKAYSQRNMKSQTMAKPRGGVEYKSSIPADTPPPADDGEEIQFYFGCHGHYIPFMVSLRRGNYAAIWSRRPVVCGRKPERSSGF
jgi:hypothetical protein